MSTVQDKSVLALTLQGYEAFKAGPEHNLAMTFRLSQEPLPTSKNPQAVIDRYCLCPKCHTRIMDEDILQRLLGACNEFQHFGYVYCELIPRCTCGQPKPLPPRKRYQGYPCAEHRAVHSKREWQERHANDYTNLQDVINEHKSRRY